VNEPRSGLADDSVHVRSFLTLTLTLSLTLIVVGFFSALLAGLQSFCMKLLEAIATRTPTRRLDLILEMRGKGLC